MRGQQPVKIFLAIFAIFCVIASVIMIKLTRGGVSIRSAPIIAPSPQGDQFKNIASSIVNRLFPDFQMSSYLVIGRPADLTMAPQIINDLKVGFESQFQKTVTFLLDDGNLSAETIGKCPQPCWILTSEKEANELSEPKKIPQILNQMEGVRHFHLTFIPFSTVPDPSDECVAEKRLSLDCLIPLSIHEVRKKFKDPETSYFFMRKYQDRDYFLFIQTGRL